MPLHELRLIQSEPLGSAPEGRPLKDFGTTGGGAKTPQKGGADRPQILSCIYNNTLVSNDMKITMETKVKVQTIIMCNRDQEQRNRLDSNECTATEEESRE